MARQRHNNWKNRGGKGVLDIGDVARRVNLPASTLRYYEQRGLIRSTGRNGLRRAFDADVLDRIAFIKLGRMAGFSLGELSVMISGDGTVSLDRDMMRRKSEELTATIARLSALRTCLRHVAECPADDHFTCPNFRKRLRSATRSQTGSVREAGSRYAGHATQDAVKTPGRTGE